jgi:hypothetical protein
VPSRLRRIVPLALAVAAGAVWLLVVVAGSLLSLFVPLR